MVGPPEKRLLQLHNVTKRTSAEHPRVCKTRLPSDEGHIYAIRQKIIKNSLGSEKSFAGDYMPIEPKRYRVGTCFYTGHNFATTY